MAEELQGLLDRIQKEGFRKVEDEKAKILLEATEKASGIIAEARREAEELTRKAKADAEVEKQRAEAAIRQSARDILIRLREELLLRLRNVVKDISSQAMTPDLMAEIIRKTVAAYLAGKDGRAEQQIELMLARKDLDSISEKLCASLAGDLKARPEISLGGDFSSGLKIGFKGGDVFLDFSDGAIADLLCAYVGTKLASIIEQGAKQ